MVTPPPLYADDPATVYTAWGRPPHTVRGTPPAAGRPSHTARPAPAWAPGAVERPPPLAVRCAPLPPPSSTRLVSRAAGSGPGDPLAPAAREVRSLLAGRPPCGPGPGPGPAALSPPPTGRWSRQGRQARRPALFHSVGTPSPFSLCRLSTGAQGPASLVVKRSQPPFFDPVVKGRSLEGRRRTA